MRISLVSGDSEGDTFVFAFDGVTGPVNDLVGVGFTAPGDIHHQLNIVDVVVLSSTFDRLSGPAGNNYEFTLPSTGLLMQLEDSDGVAAAVVAFQLADETPGGVFFSNTGSFAPPEGTEPPREVFGAFTAVPEPSSMFLGGVALAGLRARARKLRS
jgi:hypothetical protein